MFGTRSTIAAVAALTLGALGVSAQTAAQQKFAACKASVKMVNPQPVYYFEYDDQSFFDVTYNYDPAVCDSSIPVNYVRLSDYDTGASYSCTRQQFAADRTTIKGQCVLRR